MHLWIPDIPVAEKLLRSVVVYGFLLASFRVLGKRQLGQMTPFDLVVLLIISNVVQNALIGNDNSLGGGLLGAAAILALNSKENLDRERLSLSEFHAALRREGVVTVSEVRYVLLEQDGHLSVIR